MIGLPTETSEDLEAIATMIQKLKGIKGPQKRRGQINVSITTFIPKPHTPFQWAGQISQEASHNAIQEIKSRLRNRGLLIKWQDTGMSILEGVLARGDRRLAAVIEKAWQNGCVFDGWTDAFDFTRWQQAFEHCGLEMEDYVHRQRNLDEPLPWDHMHTGVRKDFLQDQWHKAHALEKIDDCRYGACHQCGVCDFKKIRPVTFTTCSGISETKPGSDISLNTENSFTWRKVIYSKLDQGRFFGHLELVNLFSRAMRRAGIKVKYSQGFHPMPRISFDDPLPLGMASEGERMRIRVFSDIQCDTVVREINARLPEGVRITSCRPRSEKPKDGDRRMHDFQRFLIALNGIEINGALLRDFEKSSQWLYQRNRPKGAIQSVDLKAGVIASEFKGEGQLYLEIDSSTPVLIRPADFLIGVLQLSQSQLERVVVTKLAGNSR